MTRAYSRWTTSDAEKLRTLHGTMPRTELARRMGRNPSYLGKKARAMGLGVQPDPQAAQLLEHIEAAGTQGISIAKLVLLSGKTERAVARALAQALTAGQVHRHRHMNADLYYASADACTANAERLRAERKAHQKALQQKYARNRYLAKLAAQGRTPRKAKPSAASTRPTSSRKKIRTTAADSRPGAQQVVMLPGVPAPVRVAASRGPANLPGEPFVPPSVIVQRGPASRDTRYTASPDAYGLGLATRRPGDYATQPSAWVSAAIASHGA